MIVFTVLLSYFQTENLVSLIICKKLSHHLLLRFISIHHMKELFMTRCNKPEGECNKLSFNILSSLFVCWQYIKKIGPLKPSLVPYLFLAQFERQFFLDKNPLAQSIKLS